MNKNSKTVQAFFYVLVISSLVTFVGYKKMNLNNSDQMFNVMNHEITFFNSKDGITLSGTLSVPDTQKKPTIVILVAGMGSADRDCLVMGRKLFVPIADYLTKRGIAVLRYDKRGVGKSGGIFDMTVTSADLAGDVVAAVEFLKNRDDIDTHNIGLAGMSEGGLISFMVASQSSDLAFVVSMAGAVATTIDDVLGNSAAQLKADGATTEFVAFDAIIRKQILQAVTTLSESDAQAKLLPLVKTYVERMTDEQKALAATLPFAITEKNYEYLVATFNSPWYRFYLHINSLDFISKVTVPVLAINGTLDFITDARLTLPIIEQGLKIAGNYDGTVIAIPNQNHWFQQCATGALAEYGAIQESMHESTLQLIADWILKRADKTVSTLDSRLATPEYDKVFLELSEMIYGSGFLSQGGPNEIDIMFAGINLTGLKMLDLGCGLGGPALYLAKNNAVEIVGIDPQVNIIQQAQEKLQAVSKDLQGKVSFAVMADPTNLKQFADNSFDIVFAIESMLHVPLETKHDYFKEIHRVVKESGQILLLDWMPAPTNKEHGLPFHLLTVVEFQQALEQAGFKNIQFFDMTSSRVDRALQNIDTIIARADEIKQRFDDQAYQFALQGWTFQKDAFESRNLQVGFFRATKN
jgi:ubiquinone/menaquinone biosynthesis C-methylase UbiE/alpha/beta superfamily hydrolase